MFYNEKKAYQMKQELELTIDKLYKYGLKFNSSRKKTLNVW